MSEVQLDPAGTFVGRVWRPGIGPSVVLVRDGGVIDITSKEHPTMSALLETEDLASHLGAVSGESVGSLEELEESSLRGTASDNLHLLAPSDLQAVKAAGVTFARSMVERVIEERAEGDLSKAAQIRDQVAEILGGSLKDLIPGSDRAMEVKDLLIKEGLWSQYLEVGIGPDAEVFTKSQPMSAVGWGAKVGLHPMSNWNNPEPEIVLAVNSKGRIQGATLGNDVNLRDVEGRSALLLGKAKDNNASASIGPFIRVFDDTFGPEDANNAVIDMSVVGLDGFELKASCSMDEISRTPASMVEQTIGRHHQYPDGFVLYLGSMFAPIEDRDVEGEGFTHKVGDVVTISTPTLGNLQNTVALSTECLEWTFGAGALMKNLAGRGLL